MATSDLDGTISALSGGITSLSPTTAVSNIESRESQLKASADPKLSGIAADLNALKAELTSGKLDGSAIGKLLVQLGTATSGVSGQAEASSQSKLATLGGLLTKAGSALGGNA